MSIKTICFTLFFSIGPVIIAQVTGLSTGGIPERSGGSYQLHRATTDVSMGPHSGFDAVPFDVTTGFTGFNFDDNSTENGGYIFIPPDPIGAAGTDQIIFVVNCMIEARSKTGIFQWRDALSDFFSPLTPANFLFDPKIVYDHYEDRFVVVALEAVHSGTNPDAGNTSRILLAVSKTASPATASSSDWYYHAINSEESRSGFDHWADYPGFEVDEEAIYITANLFAHTGGTTDFTMHLWIVDKHGGGDWYATGVTPPWTVHDPYSSAGYGGYESTTMPALVFGASGAGSGVGTYLVSYSGLTYGGPGADEVIIVIRVDNPLAATSFTAFTISIGDIENLGGVYGWPSLPDAPQSGTTTDIEVNDNHVLDAVWRHDPSHGPNLWLVTTINPNSGPDAGQTTGHWIRINTNTMTVADQGNIGGEDIATDTYTFFPSVAVNSLGDAYFGFSASATTIYPGAYATGQHHNDSPGTVRSSETVQAGLDYYQRTFGGTRNRWGDYSGAAADPTDDSKFWIFNEYALARGSGTPPEDGRWGTKSIQAYVSLSKPSTITLYGTGSAITSAHMTITESGGKYAYFCVNDVTVQSGASLTQWGSEAYCGGGTSASSVETEEANLSQDINKPDSDKIGAMVMLPESYAISQNFPNPFNPITTIKYQLPEESYVTLTVFDIRGRQVVQLINESQTAGFKSIQWNSKDRLGQSVSAGVYIYHIQAGSFTQNMKMILLK